MTNPCASGRPVGFEKIEPNSERSSCNWAVEDNDIENFFASTGTSCRPKRLILDPCLWKLISIASKSQLRGPGVRNQLTPKTAPKSPKLIRRKSTNLWSPSMKTTPAATLNHSNFRPLATMTEIHVRGAIGTASFLANKLSKKQCVLPESINMQTGLIEISTITCMGCRLWTL